MEPGKIRDSDWIIVLLCLGLALASFASKSARADDCSGIRNQVRHSLRVIVAAGTYVCSSPIVLDRDGLEFKGAGPGKTIFKLADHSNAPVIIIGHATGYDGHPPAQVHRIRASGFSVDGNQSKQEDECWGGPCYSNPKAFIHNNAVTIRAASHVELDHVDLENNRSGGLVTEIGCDHLNVHDLKSTGNHYDGIALYETSRSMFSRMLLAKNQGAGISIDLKLHDNVFKNSVIRNNHDVGIFARDAWNNTFEKIQLKQNGNHGIFGASYGPNQPDTCFRDNTLENLDIERSKGDAIRLVGQCNGNKVLNSRFQGNESDTVQSDGKILVVNSGPSSIGPCDANAASAPQLKPDLSPFFRAITARSKD